MTKILWLSPNLNHYKARFLNHLARDNHFTSGIISPILTQNISSQFEIEHVPVYSSNLNYVPNPFSKVTIYYKSYAIMTPLNIWIHPFTIRHENCCGNRDLWQYELATQPKIENGFEVRIVTTISIERSSRTWSMDSPTKGG